MKAMHRAGMSTHRAAILTVEKRRLASGATTTVQDLDPGSGRWPRYAAGLDLRALGYRVAESVKGERATHVFIRR
jgi:hypothetical protein